MHVDFFGPREDATDERIKALKNAYEKAKTEIESLGDNLTQKDLLQVVELARKVERLCGYYIVTAAASYDKRKRVREEEAKRQSSFRNSIVQDAVDEEIDF